MAATLLAVACESDGGLATLDAQTVCGITAQSAQIAISATCFAHLETAAGSSANWFHESTGVDFTFASATQQNVGVWTFSVATTGTYDLQAWVTRGADRTRQATYNIIHATSTTGGDSLGQVVRDQNGLADHWLDLGSYAFLAGGVYSVTLADDTGETTLTKVLFSNLMIQPGTGGPVPNDFCTTQTSAPACNAVLTPTGARACAFFFCANACRAFGTPIESVCTGNAPPVTTCAPFGDSALLEEDGPCASKTGPSSSWFVAPGSGGSCLEAFTVSGQPVHAAHWTIRAATAGNYRIEVLVPSVNNATRAAVYRLKSPLNNSNFQVDQVAFAGRFVDLGSGFGFFLQPGADASIDIDDATGELGRTLGLDAVRITRMP